MHRIPTAITFARLLSLPVLWWLAFMGEARWLAIGAAIAAVTDVLDGMLARGMGAITEFGSRLDSIADHLLTLSIVVWLLLLRPDFFTRHAAVLAGWVLLGAVTLSVGWIRFRRVGDLHIYSAKAAGLVTYTFALWLLYSGSYSALVFYFAAGLCYLATAESLLVYLTRTDPDERIGSILLRDRARSMGRREEA